MASTTNQENYGGRLSWPNLPNGETRLQGALRSTKLPSPYRHRTAVVLPGSVCEDRSSPNSCAPGRNDPSLATGFGAPGGQRCHLPHLSLHLTTSYPSANALFRPGTWSRVLEKLHELGGASLDIAETSKTHEDLLPAKGQLQRLTVLAQGHGSHHRVGYEDVQLPAHWRKRPGEDNSACLDYGDTFWDRTLIQRLPKYHRIGSLVNDKVLVSCSDPLAMQQIVAAYTRIYLSSAKLGVQNDACRRGKWGFKRDREHDNRSRVPEDLGSQDKTASKPSGRYAADKGLRGAGRRLLEPILQDVQAVAAQPHKLQLFKPKPKLRGSRVSG
ncbi:hypothetical protein PG997_002015 [Apiospora hydei]|uniref:Uncharacterized protein n=1 Tax=Apiospora hydei TaxID=1337664 RepID=A0ABR1X8A4_9PEZI